MSKLTPFGFVDFKQLNVGDEFVESEYGSTVFLTVTTKPKLERPDYLTFKAKTDEGKIINYGFQYPSGAYNPTIWPVEMYSHLRNKPKEQDHDSSR